MKRLVFLDESARVIFHAVLVGSIYLLFAGHNQPGGGFVGGLVAGAAISLRYLAGGIADVRRISRFQPWTILGAGIVFAAITALVPLLRGEPVLTSLGTEFDAPLLGHIYASTTLVFDIGVYMVVVGLVFMVFEAFGDDGTDAAVVTGEVVTDEVTDETTP
ncbi:MAG: MnhB domain-containing protein [Ilumatobacteraceae bacterium]